jgi:hypothetical protein
VGFDGSRDQPVARRRAKLLRIAQGDHAFSITAEKHGAPREPLISDQTNPGPLYAGWAGGRNRLRAVESDPGALCARLWGNA